MENLTLENLKIRLAFLTAKTQELATRLEAYNRDKVEILGEIARRENAPNLTFEEDGSGYISNVTL